MQEKKKTTEKLPTVPMRGTVAFPHMMMHFDVARTMSVRAVEEALLHDRKIFLTAQKDVFDERPEQKELYQIGVVAEIKQTLTQEDVTRILVEGCYRAKVKKIEKEGQILFAEVRRLPDNSREELDEVEMKALMRAVKDIYERYAGLFPRMPREILISVLCQDTPVGLYEEIVFNTMFDFKDKQLLLEENFLSRRLNLLYQILTKETMVLETEKEIHDQTQENIDQGQREYFLREQLKVISDQLREETGEEPLDDADSYAERIRDLKLPEESESKLLKEANRLRQMPPSSQEAYVISSYLDTCLELPWNTLTEENLDLPSVQKKLDADHYGLTESQGKNSGKSCCPCAESGTERTDSLLSRPSRCREIFYRTFHCRCHFQKICESFARRCP